MRIICGTLLAVALSPSSALWSADTAPFQVRVDISRTPNAKAYVEPVKTFIEDWYPKINSILFGQGYPLPFKEVQIVFERKIEFGGGQSRTEVPAYADANTIHVNYSYLTRMPDDYHAMLIHELTHIPDTYHDGSRSSGTVSFCGLSKEASPP